MFDRIQKKEGALQAIQPTMEVERENSGIDGAIDRQLSRMAEPLANKKMQEEISSAQKMPGGNEKKKMTAGTAESLSVGGPGKLASLKPSVKAWDAKLSGTPSEDNCAASVKVIKGGLGVGCDHGSPLGCGIELRATIDNVDPAYSYDVKRTIVEEKIYYKAGGQWHFDSSKNNAPDDNVATDYYDECLKPTKEKPYIYSLDVPGLPSDLETNRGETEIVVGFDMQESVAFTDPHKNTYVDHLKQNWWCLVWIYKEGGSWKLNKIKSHIATGKITADLLNKQINKKK